MTEENKEEKAPKGVDYTKAGKGDVAEKKIEKIVTGEVVVKKRGPLVRLKDLFIAADFKSVGHYVAYDVLIPAARSMLAESAIKGIERTFYGENRLRRPPIGAAQGIISRITYNAPVVREADGYRHPSTNPPLGGSLPRPGRPDFFLPSKRDADMVLDALYNLLNVYEVVSVGDFNGYVGLPVSPIDEKWGWVDLRGSAVRQDRLGWVIDLPKPEPI